MVRGSYYHTFKSYRKEVEVLNMIYLIYVTNGLKKT